MLVIGIGFAMLLIGAVLPYLARRSFARWMADGGIFGSHGPLEDGERRVRWIVRIVGIEASIVILIGVVRLIL